MGPFQYVDHLERPIREECEAITSDEIRKILEFNRRTITCLERRRQIH